MKTTEELIDEIITKLLPVFDKNLLGSGNTLNQILANDKAQKDEIKRLTELNEYYIKQLESPIKRKIYRSAKRG